MQFISNLWQVNNNYKLILLIVTSCQWSICYPPSPVCWWKSTEAGPLFVWLIPATFPNLLWKCDRIPFVALVVTMTVAMALSILLNHIMCFFITLCRSVHKSSIAWSVWASSRNGYGFGGRIRVRSQALERDLFQSLYHQDLLKPLDIFNLVR